MPPRILHFDWLVRWIGAVTIIELTTFYLSRRMMLDRRALFAGENRECQ